ncbi:MAG: DNA repair protein RecN [Acidobacteriota bacterium]|nr:DNA repair protein RecN [Acidobacteriota bacterium]
MLKSLRIRNLATIEDLQLDFEAGFTVMTGETGAGKSVIIDSIRLILGEKASSDMVRTGKAEAAVEAVFEPLSPPPPGLEDLAAGDEDLLIQRTIAEQGSGKCYINGVLVPLRKLREIAPRLVDIYGQNDHVFLLELQNHLLYLDAFLDASELKDKTAAAAARIKELLRRKKELEEKKAGREARLDILDYQIREIEAVRPDPGEEAALLQERDILKNAEKIAVAVDSALNLAYENENALLSALEKLLADLRDLRPFLPALRDFEKPLEDFGIQLRELADTLIRFRDGQPSPENLEAVEERLDLLEKLKRKYGGSIAAVCDYADRAREEYRDLLENRETLEDIASSLAGAFEDYIRTAGELSRRRSQAAEELGGIIEREIALLGMKKARFEPRLSSRAPDLADPSTLRESGTDDVEFLISPNPGEELRPLRRIASGGELSRIMLALKSAGRESEEIKTLIFDEIDSGIGGRTAEFIAEKLRTLASRHQVLCITHLPKIASSAARHVRIEKKVAEERTFTSAFAVNGEDRVMEIARLVAGSRISEASLETAREMLGIGAGIRPEKERT